jgi:L,D-peptidoglycan transpeptidase YkuD (ErfK/YbiS/YcfS/YnhG family)
MEIIVDSTGRLACGARSYRCALGRNGIVVAKTEGDHGTPAGMYPLRRVLYRADRLARPETGLPVEMMSPDQGWCDDLGHPDYNRPVRLPFSASHEVLWREDAIYDVVVVLGHNDDPPVPGKGSAIFMHIARPAYAPTEGCVALSRSDLLEVLAVCGPDAAIRIMPPSSPDVARR